jgi:hypothetical protein
MQECVCDGHKLTPTSPARCHPETAFSGILLLNNVPKMLHVFTQVFSVFMVLQVSWK